MKIPIPIFNEIVTLMQLSIRIIGYRSLFKNNIYIYIFTFIYKNSNSTNRNKTSNFPIRKDPTDFQQTNETFSLKIEK